MSAAQVHAIVVCETGGESLASCLRRLAEAGNVSKTSIVGCQGLHAQKNINSLTENERSRLKPDLYPVDDHCASTDICDRINFLINIVDNCEFVLILYDIVQLMEHSLEALKRRLEMSPGLVAINPLFLTQGGKRVAHMGTVGDCLGRMRYLYEGIPAHNPLARKRRAFQVAHQKAVLARRHDFLQAGGMNRDQPELAFTDYCLRQSGNGQAFSTEPDAVAILPDPLDSIKMCGLWNSLLMRGKLPHDMLHANYPLIAAEDGLNYSITPWLEETCDYMGSEACADPWAAWRQDPNPATLLAYLSSLDDRGMRETIRLCQSLPATLPYSFPGYAGLVERLKNFARSKNMRRLEESCVLWLKNSRRFHYRQLRPGMRVLAAAGIYNRSLDECPSVFDAWQELNEPREIVGVSASWPGISIIMPVFNPDPDFLVQAIDSVRNQAYPHWQLCIADDASTDPRVRQILESLIVGDERIKLVFLTENGHISRASNAAMGMASQPWLAFMDHDDLIPPQALARVAEIAFKNGSLRMIYSDEDHVDEYNIRRTPVFKPDFDCDLYYPGHLSCYMAAEVRKAGGLRTGYEGSQDYDLNLRITENLNSSQIFHIPEILYHWRVHSRSASSSVAAKPYVLDATRRAMESAARRQGLKGRALPAERNNFFRFLYDVDGMDCSLVLLDHGYKISDALSREIGRLSLANNLEILWQPMAEGMDQTTEKGWLKLPFASQSWQKAIMKAAASVSNPLILFLDSSLSPVGNCRLEQMLYQAKRKDLAAVGGLIWERGRLLHGGLYPDADGLPFPLLKGVARELLPAFCWGQFLLPRHVLGVSWRCMAVRREILLDEITFDAEMEDYAPADFALKAMDLGMHVLASPWGEMEGQALAQNLEKGGKLFLQKWQAKAGACGIRNANLRAAPDNDWTLIL